MTAERRAVHAERMIRAGSDNARRPDPLLDLLARMIRTAQDREHAERRGRHTRLRLLTPNEQES